VQARAHRPAAAGRDTLRLPAPPALLIGRESDRAAAAARLFAGTGRLLTLLGPGGSGKTQLALQVAWDCAAAFADGAVFVSLAPLHDAALLAQEIGQACGIAHPNARSLAEHLRDKQQLLVLDNCEHLLQAAPSIGHLLAAAPELRILATSRSALGLHDEQTLAVAPLPLPNLAQLPALAELSQIPSVALLLARTRAHNANFQLNEDNAAEIAAICVRLDGLPLALELAAARLKLLAPHDLLRRLDQRLQLLTSGARDLPARQQTLHATIDWSYRLLDADERALFERLAVFVGSWTLAAAEAIMMPRFGKAETHPALILDTIAALVDKSLVQVIVGEESRFTMLETIREYALLRLQERGGQESVAQAHAQYFLALAELAQPHFSGPHVGDWAARIEASHDNMRAALRWILNEARDAELALRMGHALYSFWHLRGYHQEGLFALERALALSLDTQSPLRAEVFSQAGFLASALGNTQRAIILFEHCLALCRTIDAPEPHIAALNGLGIMYNRANDPRGILLLEEAVQLARNVDNPSRLCAMLRALANAQVTNGDLERGIAVYDEALQLARQHQLVRNIGLILGGLGSALTFAGQYQRALPLLDESIAHQQQLQNRPHLAWLFLFLGALHFLQDEMPAARRAFAESLAIVASLGNLNSLPDTLEGVAGVCAEGDARAAARLLGAAEALRKALGTEPSPVAQEYYARCRARVRAHLDDDTFHAALEQGRALDAATALVQARALLEA
jgi:predicted ATPase